MFFDCAINVFEGGLQIRPLFAMKGLGVERETMKLHLSEIVVAVAECILAGRVEGLPTPPCTMRFQLWSEPDYGSF